MPCYLLKSPKTHAPLGEYRVLSTVNLEKLRMKLHNYALLPNFLELSLLSLLIKSNYLKLISIIRRIRANWFLFFMKIQGEWKLLNLLQVAWTWLYATSIYTIHTKSTNLTQWLSLNYRLLCMSRKSLHYIDCTC